jgi:hypothetical protein
VAGGAATVVTNSLIVRSYHVANLLLMLQMGSMPWIW